MQGFFEDNKKEQRRPPNNFDHGAAKYLHKHLAKHRLYTTRPNLEAWANQFRLLRGFAPAERIRLVLKWYVAHLRDEYVPRAHSAESFRKKFVAIESAMRKGVDPRVATISDEARAMVKKLELFWPPAVTEEDVLYVAQASLTAYAEHIAALRRAAASPRLKQHEQGLAKWMLEFSHHVPQDLIEQWMIHVWRMTHKYQEWKGSLRNWVWRPTRKWYRVWAEPEANQWTGEPDTWDRLLEMLNGV